MNTSGGPTPPTPGLGFTTAPPPYGEPRWAWWLLFGTALLPHGGLFLFMCYLWRVEAHRVDGGLHWSGESAYIVLFAYPELLLLPAGLIISLILTRSPDSRHRAKAMFAGTSIGFLLVAIMVCVVEATAG